MKQSLAQFKKDMDSITIQDIQKVREAKAKHALKLEDLEINLKTANTYVEVMTDFLEALNFNNDRIESFECRRRDGFFPHSYNKGGMEAVSYLSQTCLPKGSTGFENTDSVLEKYHNQTLKDWMEKNKHPSTDSMNDSDWESFYEYENQSADTIQFQARIMMTSENTANVDFYVSASDTPYHRQSDDKLEVEIKFKSPAGMKRQLNKLLKNSFIKCLTSNVREAF